MLYDHVTRVTTFLSLIFSIISLEVGSPRLEEMFNTRLCQTFFSMVLSLLKSSFHSHTCHPMVTRWLLHLQASCLHLRHKGGGKKRVSATSVLFIRKAKAIPELSSRPFTITGKGEWDCHDWLQLFRNFC